MFSEDLERAIRVSLETHEGQYRKGPDMVPYAVHPLHMALMLARLGMDDVAIEAALLHDVVEDGHGWTLERVEREFGATVSEVVSQLTEDKSRSWAERKQAAIDHVGGMCPRAVAVKAADKLHNLTSLVAELQRAGDPERVWSKFRGGREGTLRVGRELVRELLPRVEGPLADALRDTLAELEQFA